MNGSVDQKWFRQTAGDSGRMWLLKMSAEARIAWQMLQEYVCLAQVSQKRAGVAVALDAEEAAYQWRVAAESVETMLSAAVAAGRLAIENGSWRITDKRAYQSERTTQRGGNAENPGKSGRTTPNDGTVGIRGDSPDLSDKRGESGECGNPVERQEQGQVQGHPVTPDGATVAGGDPPATWRSLDDPLPEVPPVEVDWFDRVAWTLRTIQEKAGWKAILRSDVTPHIAPGKPVRALIELYGEIETVAIFLFAHATWSAEKRPTWSAVLAQREQIRERIRTCKPDREEFPERAASARMSNRDLARETIRLIAERGR